MPLKLFSSDPATGNPTPHYNAYLYYQQKYFDAQQNLNGQYANAVTDPTKFAMWPITWKNSPGKSELCAGDLGRAWI